jgi:3-oxoacyl-[acyl-carrier-protein] synthase II
MNSTENNQKSHKAQPGIKRRVVITGIGAVTPLGLTWESTWKNLLLGKKGVSQIKLFDASEFPCDFAYQVEDFVLDKTKIETLPTLEVFNRAASFGWNAAWEALRSSALLDCKDLDPHRLSVSLGVGMGCKPFDWYSEYLSTGSFELASTEFCHKDYPSTLGNALAEAIGCRGGVFTVHTACASSGQSVGEAFEMVAMGESDYVLTGGADSMINPFHIAGFCLLGALSSRKNQIESASRPFDAARDGFVLGEGAAMFVFESLEHALARKARIFAEVCGYGVTESAYRITDLHPEGRGVIESMQMALEDANIEPSDVGYVNAHGTSTLLNDRIESLAIEKVFEKSASKPLVGSTKSMTGHLISAAGAIEFAVAASAVAHGSVPPSVNVVEQDPLCKVVLVPDVQSQLRTSYALSNSVGFGGSNTTLVARRYQS